MTNFQTSNVITMPRKNLYFCIWSVLVGFGLTGCTDQPSEKITLEGTWELLSETKIENGDTTFTPASSSQRMIKIINATHFAFLRHDLNSGKDSSATFTAGGGTYSLVGDVYKEHLEFFNLREWENHDFKFTVGIRNDTLIQQGEETVEGTGINRYIIEKYHRVLD